MLASLAQNFSNKMNEPLLPTHLAAFFFTLFVLTLVPRSTANVEGDQKCGYVNSSACSWGTGVGVLSLLTSIAFIAVELNWDSERIAAHHRYIYLGEMITAGILGSLFVILLFMEIVGVANASQAIKDGVGNGWYAFGIIFTFAAALAWGMLGYLSRKGYKEDDIGGIERLTARGGLGGGYLDPVTSAYHGATMYESSNDPPVP